MTGEQRQAVAAAATRLTELIDELPTAEDRLDALNEVMDQVRRVHPHADPVSCPRWVPAERLRANNYNPNRVAPTEMRLLHVSIAEDGYTQPIVVYQDGEDYVIVDGFHRNRVGQEYRDVRERVHGRLPVVIIDKDLGERMASTIRHNRARGEHRVQGMSDIVVALVTQGWDDARSGLHLGRDVEEILRLKQVGGWAVLEREQDRHYSRSWVLAPDGAGEEA